LPVIFNTLRDLHYFFLFNYSITCSISIVLYFPTSVVKHRDSFMKRMLLVGLLLFQ